jgi:hypothetical protein
MGVSVATFYLLATKIGNNDNKKEVKDAMLTVGGLNIGATLLMLILATWFTRANPELRSTYTFLMTHLNFLLAIVAVSISVIIQYSA